MPLAIALAVFAVAGGQLADRAWQTGKWVSATVTTAARGRAAMIRYVIDADEARYDVEETATPGVRPPKVKAGEAVAFAVESDVVYVREGATTERPLRLVKTTRKLRTYGAAG